MSGAPDVLDGAAWQRLITAAAVRVVDNVDELSRLDAAVGDGDHGVNVSTALEYAKKEVAALSNPTPADVLRVTAVSFLDEMGGAAGALFGSFFLSMARVVKDHLSVGVATLADALEAGTEMVMKRGKATVGDKTMVDALAPAADAARASAVSGAPMEDALTEVAKAARAGVASTVSMKATLGRARYVGESSIGVQDAGATTVLLIFEAWASEYHKLRGDVV